MPRDKASVTRKINFLFATVGVDQSGEWIPFQHSPVLADIKQLSFDNGDRYLDIAADEAVYCLFIDKIGKQRGYVTWAKIRRDALPEIELRGNLTDLDIDVEAGVAEISHAIFFPGNIIGFESNSYARPTRLAVYLRRKSPDICLRNLDIEPLLKPDVRSRLKELKSVSLLRIGATTTFFDAITAADETLGRAFKSGAKAGNAEEIEITMRGIQPLSGTDRLGWLRKLARLIGLAGADTALTEFQVGGQSTDTNKHVLIDLLSDKLVTSKKILRQGARTRVVDPNSAWDAIEDAYEEMLPEINAAIGDLERSPVK